MGKAILAAVGLLFGFILICFASGRSPDAVSRQCRSTVAQATLNVDAWQYIQAVCPESEQQALLREFRQRGLSTEALDKSRSGR